MVFLSDGGDGDFIPYEKDDRFYQVLQSGGGFPPAFDSASGNGKKNQHQDNSGNQRSGHGFGDGKVKGFPNDFPCVVYFDNFSFLLTFRSDGKSLIRGMAVLEPGGKEEVESAGFAI